MLNYGVIFFKLPEKEQFAVYVPDLGIHFFLPIENNTELFKKTLTAVVVSHVDHCLNTGEFIFPGSSDQLSEETANFLKDGASYTIISVDRKIPENVLSWTFPKLSWAAALIMNSLYSIFSIYSMRLSTNGGTSDEQSIGLSSYTSINGLFVMMIVFYCSHAADRAYFSGHQLYSFLRHTLCSAQTFDAEHATYDITPLLDIGDLSGTATPESLKVIVSKYNEAKLTEASTRDSKLLTFIMIFLVLCAAVDAVTVGVNEYQKNKLLINQTREDHVEPFPHWLSMAFLILDVICKPLTIFMMEGSFAWTASKPIYRSAVRFFSCNQRSFSRQRLEEDNYRLLQQSVNNV